jgi:pyruvate kinase
MRKTKIIATVGPACASIGKLQALMQSGADVMRINASHTSPQTLRQWILDVRRAASQLKKFIPIMVDLQGPRIRTGALIGGGPVRLYQGAMVEIIPGLKAGTAERIATSCKQFSSMVAKGDPVLLDNGYLELRVEAVRGDNVHCTIQLGGLLGENKGINLPQAPATLPALTQKDIASLAVATKMKIDYVALSFVRDASDVLTLKKRLKALGRPIPVIAKIEKPWAVQRIEAILRVSECIMVARGDLGIEMGLEKVPLVQKRLIARANTMGIPVITATQMLESMIEHPCPTRAEASDVANAVLDGSDALMLSGETAVGKYSKKAIRMMAKIIDEVERYVTDTQKGKA